MNPKTLKALCTSDLRAMPSQSCGGVRIVPLVRDDPSHDIRLGLVNYGEDLALVKLGGRPGGVQGWMAGYMPQGMIVDWSADGEPVAAARTGLGTHGRLVRDHFAVRVEHRLVKRKGKGSLRMIPFAAAIEGFLALHFGGPHMAWEEYSSRALSRGLDPRAETFYSGDMIQGLEEALRIFELHPGQCGAMVFVADALAAVTVLSHPDDYRRAHRSLLLDSYGELIWHYGCLYGDTYAVQPGAALLNPPRVQNTGDLRGLVSQMRDGRADLYATMSAGIFAREIQGEVIYQVKQFQVERFMTDLAVGQENHIGECIRRGNGRVEYLKTARLSAAQGRKAYLLRSLHRHAWNITDTAAFLGTTWEGLMLRIESVGFGDLLRTSELDRARKLARG